VTGDEWQPAPNIGFCLGGFAADLLCSGPRFQGLLRCINFPPQGRSPPLAPPFLVCAPDAIPFRRYAVAELTGIHDNKGEQPLRPPLPDWCL